MTGADFALVAAFAVFLAAQILGHRLNEKIYSSKLKLIELEVQRSELDARARALMFDRITELRDEVRALRVELRS